MPLSIHQVVVGRGINGITFKFEDALRGADVGNDKNEFPGLWKRKKDAQIAQKRMKGYVRQECLRRYDLSVVFVGVDNS